MSFLKIIQRYTKEDKVMEIFSGFGYGLWYDDTLALPYIVLDGEGTIVENFRTSFEAKKWMKENKTSDCWRADGKWDWNRIA